MKGKWNKTKQSLWHLFLSCLPQMPYRTDPFFQNYVPHKILILFGRKAVRSSFRNGGGGRLLGHSGIIPLTASSPNIWGFLNCRFFGCVFDP